MKSLFILLLCCLIIAPLYAQHEHHTEDKVDTTSNHAHHERMNMDQQMDSASAPMSHAFSLNLPMNRNGSGTGWLPDAAPMYGYMLHAK